MSTDRHRTKWHKTFAENFNLLNRVHERYRRQMTHRRQTDERAITYSEREREFTVAKNLLMPHLQNKVEQSITIKSLRKSENKRVKLK